MFKKVPATLLGAHVVLLQAAVQAFAYAGFPGRSDFTFLDEKATHSPTQGRSYKRCGVGLHDTGGLDAAVPYDPEASARRV